MFSFSAMPSIIFGVFLCLIISTTSLGEESTSLFRQETKGDFTMSTMNETRKLGTGVNQMSAAYMIRISIFSALAFVVMFIEFPIAALFPVFLQIDLSDVVVFIGGVTMGPLAVVFIELVKNLLHLMLRGGTGGVGELANFLVGVGLILPAVIIFNKYKTFISLLIGMFVGIISMVLVASLGNYFIFLPLWGVPTEDLIADIIALYAPFNVVKGGIVAVVAVVIHQSMKGIYKYIALNPND